MVYEAVELAIEYISPQLYLCLLPTVHVSKLNGEKLPKQDYQYQINQRISTMYNKEYNEKLKYWEGLFRKTALYVLNIRIWQLYFTLLQLVAEDLTEE